MAIDRSGYGRSQRALLESLLRGAGFPPGFLETDAQRASLALRAKRARLVQKAWPALTLELGDRFETLFGEYAGTAGPPEHGGGLADGLLFLQSLDRQKLGDDLRAETLLAKAIIRARRGHARLRHGPYLGSARLRDPRRILVVVAWRTHIRALTLKLGLPESR